MRYFIGQWQKTLATLFAIGMLSPVFAVNVTPSTASLLPKQSQYIATSAVSGLVKIKNMNPAVVSVGQVGRGIYRIYALAPGNATVVFSDKKGSSTVAIAVAALSASNTLTGRLLASNCFQCHGTNGSGGFERLMGQSQQEIFSELKEFASGLEESDGIMAAHAMGFSDAQMRDIAVYFSTIK